VAGAGGDLNLSLNNDIEVRVVSYDPVTGAITVQPSSPASTASITITAGAGTANNTANNSVTLPALVGANIQAGTQVTLPNSNQAANNGTFTVATFDNATGAVTFVQNTLVPGAGGVFPEADPGTPTATGTATINGLLVNDGTGSGVINASSDVRMTVNARPNE